MVNQENLSPFQEKLINFWVKLRTSFTYLWFFIGFCLIWVIWNKSSLVPLAWHTDNLDLTYLNLMLSIMAEVSAITILVYTLRISEHQDKAAKKSHEDIEHIKELLDKTHNAVRSDRPKIRVIKTPRGKSSKD